MRTELARILRVAVVAVVSLTVPVWPAAAEADELPATLKRGLEAHGGIEHWRSFAAFTWELRDWPLGPQAPLNDRHVDDLKRRRHLVVSDRYRTGFDGRTGWAVPSAEAVGLPPDFYPPGSFYFVAMPFVFADPGAIARDAGEMTVGDNRYDAVTINYRDDAGVSPDDDYVALFDPETGRLAMIHFTVTHARMRGETPVDQVPRKALVFEAWQDADGLLVPARASFYGWEDGRLVGEPAAFRVTSPDFHQRLPEDVSFDKAVHEAAHQAARDAVRRAVQRQGHAALPTVHYRRQRVGELEIFYREAGDPSAPTLLLMHGFPSSSHMFRELIPRLAHRFHVIAPDYPGFGHSSMPPHTDYDYTFDQLSRTMEAFLRSVNIQRFIMYVQDYGGPVGMRIVERNPGWLAGLIVQNANFYEAGILPLFHEKIGPLWTERTAETEAPVRELLTLEGTKFQYQHGARDPQAMNPDAWVHDQYGLNRPGNVAIQLNLQADYHTNIARYDRWRNLLMNIQPPTLIVWGKGDPIFGVRNVTLLQRDLEMVEAHLLDGSHFALEEHAPFIADRIRAFFGDGSQSADGPDRSSDFGKG